MLKGNVGCHTSTMTNTWTKCINTSIRSFTYSKKKNRVHSHNQEDHQHCCCSNVGIFRDFLAFLVAQTVKNLPEMQETRVQSMGQKSPLGKGIATHSSILAWRIPWTEDPGGL